MSRRNTDAVAFEVVRRWPSLRSKRWAISTLKALASQSGTAAIVGIGSAVRRVHHPGSDVDFLVIADIEGDPAPPPPVDVDLWIIGTGQVDRRLGERDELLGGAIRFGRRIFERDRYWTNLHARWSDHMPFPSPKNCDTLAARFEHFAQQMVSDFDAASEQIIGMLTHRGRASLIRAGVYPASRPELPAQLRKVGESQLAQWLAQALQRKHIAAELLDRMKLGSVEPAEM